MNVLLTCAGRRSELVSFFQSALGGRGVVVATDADENAPALAAADVPAVVPSITDDGYVEALLDVCERESVSLVVPSMELELPLLAVAREKFASIGATVVVSSPEVTELCFDKLATDEFLRRSGLSAPACFATLESAIDALDEGRLSFPVIIKPRWGTTSVGLHRAVDRDHLVTGFRRCADQIADAGLCGGDGDGDRQVIVQPEVGGVEFGLDVVNDLNGDYVTTFVKRKLRMRGGQTDRAVTVDDPVLLDVGRRIGVGLRHRGLLDCDVMLADDAAYVIDLNPRIGGGYPFSHLAGADYPAALLAWCEQRRPDDAWLTVEAGVTVGTTDRHVVSSPAMAAAARYAGK